MQDILFCIVTTHHSLLNPFSQCIIQFTFMFTNNL